MKLIKNERVIDIMEKTMNHVDARLIDHGKRVAYLMYKVLAPLNKYSERQLRDICLLAMLHDIGAYKTEEIDKMVIFETVDVWEHSLYGYLFLKTFSPLAELSPAILFHHADCHELSSRLSPELTMLSQLISLTDRADVYVVHKGSNKDFLRHIEKNRDIKYFGPVVDMYLASGINIDTVFEQLDTDTEFDRVFRHTPLSTAEVEGYIKMVIFSIDFRSPQTVIHTVATACIAETLGRLKGLNSEQLTDIRTAAMLHDIGKIGIPLAILESTGRLGPEEFAVMKTHVEISAEILTGNVHDTVRDMAVHHHEKLNGMGYPYNIEADGISFLARLVAAADIFSALCGARSYKDAYPKEKIIGILEDMRATHHLDSEIVDLCIADYETILTAIEKTSAPILQTYNDINTEYKRLKSELENRKFEELLGAVQ